MAGKFPDLQVVSREPSRHSIVRKKTTLTGQSEVLFSAKWKASTLFVATRMSAGISGRHSKLV